MDLKRQVSISDINPKSFKNESNKTSQISNVLSNPKPASNDSVSPLKRKMPEMTSLSGDAKRRRHHRRKPNKKWRHKSVTCDELNKSINSQREVGAASAGVATQPKCQKKSRKDCVNINLKAKIANTNSSANQSSWKRKRKGHNSFFHQQQHYNNSSSAASAGATGSNTGQHGNAGTQQGIRMPANPNGGPGRKRTNVVLRPTKVPLLNAPRNSTQFIIDDHESSDLVWNFEGKIPGQRKQTAVAAERYC
jgi:hypothetical protein